MSVIDQRLPIASPPWPGLGRKIEGLVRKACYEFSLLENSPSIAIALSGGKDSLSLLYMLHAIKGRGFLDFDLFAVHVSGAFSCGAALHDRYLERICETLNVPLSVCHVEQDRQKLECYSCSRERRKLLFAEAKKLGCSTIAFGHHRDDHIQTFLMNLLHKSEIEGNLPKVKMHRYGITIVRPLIHVSEKDIIEFAKANQFARITCQCPVGQNTKRKQVENYIQSMEKDFPNIRGNLAKAAHLHGTQKALCKNLETH